MFWAYQTLNDLVFLSFFKGAWEMGEWEAVMLQVLAKNVWELTESIPGPRA